MKIAVFGGSFNPLHNGHAMLAETVVKELGYDKIIFVPTYLPPHKTMNVFMDPAHRLKMLQLFCEKEGNGHFAVDSCEIDRQGISYTVDTLEYLSEKYKDVIEGKLAFILGDEIAAEFYKWKNPERIAEIADLIVTHRYKEEAYGGEGMKASKNIPSGNYKGDFAEKFDPNTFAYPFTFIKGSVLPVSSSDIRSRIEKKQSFKYLIPTVIYDYITENKLYNY